MPRGSAQAQIVRTFASSLRRIFVISLQRTEICLERSGIRSIRVLSNFGWMAMTGLCYPCILPDLMLRRGASWAVSAPPSEKLYIKTPRVKSLALR